MAMRKIAVIGGSGQLGTELCRQLGSIAIPLARSNSGMQSIDISDFLQAQFALKSLRPDFVINTVAWNLVDKAEVETQQAFTFNAFGPRNLGLICSELKVPILHVSTDYVFGRIPKNKPYTTEDSPSPVNAYGLSKLAGEEFVKICQPNNYIVRTCGLYSTTGNNFVKTILNLAKTKSEVQITDNHCCTPTNVEDLAEQIILLINRNAPYGTYHVTNSGQTTWYEFATEIVRCAKLKLNITKLSIDDFEKTYCKRPGYSVLCCEPTLEVTGKSIRTWNEALSFFITKSCL